MIESITGQILRHESMFAAALSTADINRIAAIENSGSTRTGALVSETRESRTSRRYSNPAALLPSNVGRHGFVPQNLPGYGFNHDNLGQNGSVIWTRILSPNLVNTASASVSRLAMFHYTENNGVNDIVGALGITGVNFAAPRGLGRSVFQTCKGIPRWETHGSLHRCTCGTQFWRDANTLSWQRGRHSMKFGGSYRWYIWPMWGIGAEPRLLFVHLRVQTRPRRNDGTGAAFGEFPAWAARVATGSEWSSDDGPSQWQASAFVQTRGE